MKLLWDESAWDDYIWWHPVLVLGSDVWRDGAEGAAREFAEELRLPVVANGQGRGVLPAGHELLVTCSPTARPFCR